MARRTPSKAQVARIVAAHQAPVQARFEAVTILQNAALRAYRLHGPTSQAYLAAQSMADTAASALNFAR